MLYISRLIKNADSPGYPFSVPAIAATQEIAFTAPVTILCGDNGSGKSTLLSILAAKLKAVRIGQGIIEREHTVDAAQDAFTLHKLPCKRNFLFSAEDFIAYVTWVSQTKAEAKAEIARINEDDTIADKAYAKMPHYRTLSDLSGLYAEDLALQSHGEGFLDFFQSRLQPGGLYLMDEPEGALSFEKQFALALLIQKAAENCQFILATHSPILTAIPGANILEATEEGFLPRKYSELENIQFLKLFMENPQRMFR
ncbi:MAG: AAA family ATPase [Clostridia bacterium]|nr:AAA family ATPase [Clostridia bacterium]